MILERPIPAGVLATPAICADLRELLLAAVDQERRFGRTVPAAFLVFVQEVARVAAAYEAHVRNIGTPEVPTEVPMSLDRPEPESMTVRQVAALRRTTERAVTKRLASGSLKGRKVKGKWQIDVDQLEESA